MPKTLAEIELSCDPLLTTAELDWWQRVWADVAPGAGPEDVIVAHTSRVSTTAELARAWDAATRPTTRMMIHLPDGDDGAEGVL